MNASDLRLFHLVVKSESFHHAAQAAGLSAPALSKRISKLEEDLGTQLIYRTTRSLTLTEAGVALSVYAKNIHEQLQEAIAVTTNLSEEMSGTLKLSVPTLSAELLLADAVASFCQQYPAVSINMQTDNHFVDLVKDGVDLAIRSGVLEDNSLKARHLLNSQWILCCSPHYLEQFDAPTTLDDLQQHRCLVYTQSTQAHYDWLFTQDQVETIIKVKSHFVTNNNHVLKRAALAGTGITYVPKCCVYEELQNGELVEILAQYKARSIGVYAVYPFTRHMPLKLRRLIDHIDMAYQAKRDYFE